MFDLQTHHYARMRMRLRSGIRDRVLLVVGGAVGAFLKWLGGRLSVLWLLFNLLLRFCETKTNNDIVPQVS